MSDTKPKRDFKTITLTFGKKTKVGGWSNDLTIDEFEKFQGFTKEQIVGARISHREITSINKKTGEKFQSLVYEIILPERIAEIKAASAGFTKRPDADDDL